MRSNPQGWLFFNPSLTFLARTVRTPVLLIVAAANLSQFAKDVHAHRTGRWKPRLGAITSIDGFFLALVASALIFSPWLKPECWQ
jgi:hypothetical protein